jgi:hypothetical protein
VDRWTPLAGRHQYRNGVSRGFRGMRLTGILSKGGLGVLGTGHWKLQHLWCTRALCIRQQRSKGLESRERVDSCKFPVAVKQGGSLCVAVAQSLWSARRVSDREK